MQKCAYYNKNMNVVIMSGYLAPCPVQPHPVEYKILYEKDKRAHVPFCSKRYERKKFGKTPPQAIKIRTFSKDFYFLPCFTYYYHFFSYMSSNLQRRRSN